jgi:hypothetical protein
MLNAEVEIIIGARKGKTFLAMLQEVNRHRSGDGNWWQGSKNFTCNVAGS